MCYNLYKKAMKKLILVLIIVFFNIIFYFLAKYIKLFLFKKRKNIRLRLLFSRVEKFLLPFILLVDINTLYYIFDLYPRFYNYLFFINLALIFWFVYEILKYFIYTSITIKIKEKKSVRRELFSLIINLTKVSLVLIYIIVLLSKLGVNLTAIITSLGIGGIIIGLAAKETISNFFDSIRIVSEDAFHVGDWIETRDFEGFVTEIGLTSTQIRTFDNALIIIPNSKLANDWVKNWSRRIIGRRIKFWLKLKPTTDVEELNRVVDEIRMMLKKHPQIVTDEKIKNKLKKNLYKNALFSIEDKYGVRKTLLVYVDKIDEYSIDILIYAFSITIDWEEWLKIKQDVIYKILEIIKNSKLELAFPTYIIYEDKKENLWKS